MKNYFFVFALTALMFSSCKSSKRVVVSPEIKADYETISSGIEERYHDILFALPDTSNKAVLRYGLGEGHAILNRYITDTIDTKVIVTPASSSNDDEDLILTNRAFDKFIEEVGGLLGEAWISKKDKSLYLSFGVPMGNEYLLCSVDSTGEALAFLYLSNRKATEYSKTTEGSSFRRLRINPSRFKVVFDQHHPQPGAILYGYIEMESSPYLVADFDHRNITKQKKIIEFYFKISVGYSDQTFENRYPNEEAR